MSPHNTPINRSTSRHPRPDVTKPTALAARRRSRDEISILGRLGWTRDGASRAWTPDDSWLDTAENHLRDLAAEQDPPVPPHLADLLTPHGRDKLRTLLRSQVGPDHATGGTDRCEIPWQGCPRHGDALAPRSLVEGWRCTVEGCGFTTDTAVSRMQHCDRPAVAMLTGEPDAPDGLAVCAAHLESETDRASYGGDAMYVRPLGTDPTLTPALTLDSDQWPLPDTSANWLDVVDERMKSLLPEWYSTHHGLFQRLRFRVGHRLGHVVARLEVDRAWLEAVGPGVCGIPWLGCPRHGDLLEFAGAKHGWVCTVPGCDLSVEMFRRVEHCQNMAVAVLADSDDTYQLPVCDAHLYGEVENASYGGEPVTVTYLDPRRAA